ncbi:hypothetical protein RRG08_035573 [Elysia crispata]|uniref:Uncharacterized protein n=1 Tax=Elysia crispata TaxID=231223 RepID=A0AAE1B5K7_9GAST|nr:hypothetical protein RRG08_035573 [Elysia crispata]
MQSPDLGSDSILSTISHCGQYCTCHFSIGLLPLQLFPFSYNIGWLVKNRFVDKPALAGELLSKTRFLEGSYSPLLLSYKTGTEVLLSSSLARPELIFSPLSHLMPVKDPGGQPGTAGTSSS